MAILTKAEIVSAVDSQFETFPVPEWGGEVRIRSLTGEQTARLSKCGLTSSQYDALCCAMGIIDENGNPFFTEAETAVLAKKHPFALDQICNRIMFLSAINAEGRAEAQKKRNPIAGSSSSQEPSTPVTA